MKLLAIFAALAITPFALAHPDHQPEHPDHPSDHPDHPDHPSDHPEHPETGESKENSEAAAQAEALLKKVHNAYKNADAITETLTVTMPAMMGEEKDTMTLTTVVGSKSGKIVAEDQMTAVWKDGKVFMILEDMDDVYIEQTGKTFTSGLKAAFGPQGMPGLWTITLRESDDASDWLSVLSMGMPGATFAGVTEEDGLRMIDIKTMVGSVAVHVSKSDMISNVVISMEQPGMPSMEINAVADTSFVKEIPAVSFDAGDRKKYDSMEAIFEAMADEEEVSLEGKGAPDFTLETLDGSGNVKLSDLKGTVVVLDFWATWCGPCKKGLPALNEFDTWAKAQGLDVKVFAVNVWERGGDKKVKETVQKFWSKYKYTTSVLMASDSESLTKEYGLSGIPATFIIGTDGSIVESHVGYSPDMLETLKKSVTKALAGKSKEHPDHPDHPDHPN